MLNGEESAIHSSHQDNCEDHNDHVETTAVEIARAQLDHNNQAALTISTSSSFSSSTTSTSSSSSSSSSVRSLHKTTTPTPQSSTTTVTATTPLTPSTTSHLPIGSKVGADLSAMQTVLDGRYSSPQNQNETQEEPELLPEEPVEASLVVQEESEEGKEVVVVARATAIALEGEEDEDEVDVEVEYKLNANLAKSDVFPSRQSSAIVDKKVVRDDQQPAELIADSTKTATTTTTTLPTTTAQIATDFDHQRKLWLDCNDVAAVGTLTSLSAHVDEARRQVNELLGVQNNDILASDKAGEHSPSRKVSIEQNTNTNSSSRIGDKSVQQTAVQHQVALPDRNNPLTLLRFLMQKRDELKQVDKQLFNIMTQYLLQLDSSSLIPNLPAETLWSLSASPIAHLQQQQQQMSAHQYQRQPYTHFPESGWLGSQYDHLAVYDLYRQMELQNAYNDTLLNQLPMDLTAVNKTTLSSSITSSSSIATGLRSNSSASLETPPTTGKLSADITSNGSAMATTNPFSESFKMATKVPERKSSVNLKKSRLLADLNLTSTKDDNYIISHETQAQPNRQTSPLNLLKRYCSPTQSENSSIQSTSRRTSSASTSAQYGGPNTSSMQRAHLSSSSSLATGVNPNESYLFATSNRSLSTNDTVQQRQHLLEDNVPLNPQHKKFRPFSQVYFHQDQKQQQQQTSTINYSIPQDGTVKTTGLFSDHFNMEAHHHYKQQEQLLSEMLIEEQQRHRHDLHLHLHHQQQQHHQRHHQYHQSKQLHTRSVSPQPTSLTLMTTPLDASGSRNQVIEASVLNYRNQQQQQHHHHHQQAQQNQQISFDSRPQSVSNQDINNYRSFSNDRATAYILATMQHTEASSAASKIDPLMHNKQSRLQIPQVMQSGAQMTTNSSHHLQDDNLHTVTITPAKLSGAPQNSLELVRATIGKDHQLVPVQVEPISSAQVPNFNHHHHHHHHENLRPRMAYRCHVCGSGFEDRHRLQQHLSIHLNLHPSWFEEKTIKETMAQYEAKRGDYLCSLCNLRHETTAEFDKHMQLHGDKPHRCDLCDQDNKLVCFRYYRQLLTHLRSHCFLYSCRFAPDCKQTSNRKDYLKLHILKHHLNNKLPEQYTICCH